jgi:hypothetical protein
MSSEAENLDWFKEHLKYEIQMFRRAYAEILKFSKEGVAGVEGQYFYNLTFESFIVHARNLSDFLQSAGGSRNHNAKTFAPSFVSKDYRKVMESPMRRLHEQVFHMGKQRIAVGEGKFTGADCKRVYDWIESQLEAFGKVVEPSYSGEWSAMNAGRRLMQVPPNTPASATNVTSSTFTSHVVTLKGVGE